MIFQLIFNKINFTEFIQKSINHFQILLNSTYSNLFIKRLPGEEIFNLLYGLLGNKIEVIVVSPSSPYNSTELSSKIKLRFNLWPLIKRGAVAFPAKSF